MEGRRVGPAAAAATTPRTTETMPRTSSPQYRRAHSRPHHGVGQGEAAKASTVVVAVSVLSAGIVALALIITIIITRIHKLNTSVKELSTQQRAATPAITKSDLEFHVGVAALRIEDGLKQNFDRVVRAFRDEQRALRQVQRVLLQRTNTTEDTKPTKCAQPASASSASQDAASCGFHGEHEMGEGMDIFKYRRTVPRPSALASG